MKIETSYIEKPLEISIFGYFGENNLIKIGAREVSWTNFVFTTSLFTEQFPDEIHENAPVWCNTNATIKGPFEIKTSGSVKITQCSIYWNNNKNKKFIKQIPFAWIFGKLDFIYELNAEKEAESDFYGSLFGKLSEFIMDSDTLPSKEIRSKIKAFYFNLVNQVELKFKSTISLTQGDEHIFQDLLDNYKFFLSPEAKSISSQPILSGEIERKADYVITVSDNHIIYVEIEPPFYNAFNGINPSKRLVTALNQVEDWQKINKFDKNIDYWIIIGRETDLDVVEKNALLEFNKSQKNVKIFTWNDIIKNIEQIKQEIIKIAT